MGAAPGIGGAALGAGFAEPSVGPLVRMASDGRSGAADLTVCPRRRRLTESAETAITVVSASTVSPTAKGLAGCPLMDSSATPRAPAAMTPATLMSEGPAGAVSTACGAGALPKSDAARRKSIGALPWPTVPAGATGVRGASSCSAHAAQMAHSATNSSTATSGARGTRSRMVEISRWAIKRGRSAAHTHWYHNSFGAERCGRADRRCRQDGRPL